MKIKSTAFVVSGLKPSQYPLSDRPEIAFAGRSNVGKSSLINAMLGVKKLVKTGATPGRTQMINFFSINDRFFFVDLPGYGYAKVPAEVQKKWGPMVETYLKDRAGLRVVVVILDIRRTPNEADRDLIDWLAYYGIPEIVVLTKGDKLKRGKRTIQWKRIAEDLGIEPSSIIIFSSSTGMGKEALWKALEVVL